MKGSPGEAPTLSASGFFLLRTPLLPIDDLQAWSAGLRAAHAVADETAFPAALEHDRAELRQRLRAIVARPEVREALFVASPSLEASLHFWQESPDSERGQKVERTLVRYLARMSIRSTPFGLFAGCSVGANGDRTQLVLDGSASYRRHTTLDAEYLSDLFAALVSDPEIRPTLTWRPNSSLYRAAERLHYFESYKADGGRKYQLTAAEPTSDLERALTFAAQGTRLDSLAAALVDEEVTLEETRAYVEQLADAELLVPDLQLQLSGGGALEDAIAQLDAVAAECPSVAAVSARLTRAKAGLRELDAVPLGGNGGRYHDIANSLNQLPTPLDIARLFHTVLLKPTTAATLGGAPLGEMTRAIAALHQLSGARAPDPAWSRFCQAFGARYEKQRVPLTQALDPDLGIGFAHSTTPSGETMPLLDWLHPPVAGDEAVPINRAYLAVLQRRLDEALRHDADEIVLDDTALAEMAPPTRTRRPLPSGLAVMATIVAESAAAVDNGHFRLYLGAVSGPSGVRLLGRFCHALEGLAEQVRAHLRREEATRPDAIFADIVHRPPGRARSTCLRPCFHEWEIPFLGRGGVAADRQIAIDDIDIAVVGGRVRLHSRRHGREIIPRLTSAHNHTLANNVDVYRFLCALQRQNAPQLELDWGVLDSAPYLPRVRVGNTILSAARWRLDKEAIARLSAKTVPERFRAAQRLRRSRRLPRWVAVVDGDNILPIDFENVLSLETFVHLIKQRDKVLLTEVEALGGAVVRGPEGSFAHELIVPFLVPSPTAAPSAGPAGDPPPSQARSLLPGSEWLYAKVFTAKATANLVLREIIAPVVRAAVASGEASSWFFVRNAEPHWHLRIRLHGEPRRLLAEALPRLTAAMEEARARGLIWKLQTDTYEREIERYGGSEGMLLSEQLFAADSDAVLAIVELLDGDDAKDLASRLALRGLDNLLDDLGFTLREKYDVVNGYSESLEREFMLDTHSTRELGAVFRREREGLESLLSLSDSSASALAPLIAPFTTRSRVLRPIAARFRAAEQQGRLTQPLMEIASSFLHMHVNRMLQSRSRAQELILYSLLARIYKGKIIRQKSGE